MGAIRQVVYISRATHPFTQAELDELVKVSQDNNKKYGITGAMLYLENAFIQVIEGEGSVVAQLLKNLYADSRHRDIRIVSDSVVPARNFPELVDGCSQAPAGRANPGCERSSAPRRQLMCAWRSKLLRCRYPRPL